MADNFKQYISGQLSRISPRIAILGVVLAAALVAGVIYQQSRSESTAEAKVAPYAARVEQVEGSVGVASALNEEDAAELEWEEADRNTPLVAGDRVYAREGSRASVAFTGRNYARLDSGSALDVLSLTDERTQLALRDGSALFDIGELVDDGLFEVATPNGAIDFNEPGLYQVGIGDDGNTWITVLSGLAQVVGLAGSGEISKGEMMTLAGQTAAQVLLSKLAPDYAGEVVDDYYDYRYPDTYDGRYRDYDTYLDDPYYYDPYRSSVSYDNWSYDVPGIYDLDHYGDWREVDGYGHCWTPRVDAGWTPYRNGYWDANNLYGPTWVSNEPWGWAPYHYGRWAYVNNSQWVWVPERSRRRPVYAPALVAFVPITQTNHIGWVPLAPGEVYVPRYYNASYQPQYLASPEIVQEVVTVQRTYVNASYPQAVTAVPWQRFTQVIEPQYVAQVNPQYINQAHATLDPYQIENLRLAAARGDNSRRRFKMERAWQQQVFNTPVVTAAAPVVMPGREGVAEAWGVATVPEKQRKQKFKVQNSEQVVTTRQPGVVAQAPTHNAAASQQRFEQLATQAEQGDKSARREMKRLRREQQAVGVQPVLPSQPRMNAQNQPQATQPAVNERKAQRQLMRQQQQVNPQVQPQTKQQRKAEKRAEQQRLLMQQQEQANAASAGATVNPQKQQRRAQRELMRQQQVQQQQAVKQQQARQQQEQLLRQQQKQARRQQAQQQPELGLRNQQRRQQQELMRQQQQQQMLKQQRRQQQQQVYQQQNQQRQMQKQQMRQQRQQQVQQQQVQQQQIQQQKQRLLIQQTEKQQRKAERRATMNQPAPRVVMPQQQQQRQVAPQPRQVSPAKAQRQAEKAQRKGKGNQ